jgi:hypothetical protein
MFDLSPKQTLKLNKWKKAKDYSIYTGAIGGRFTYEFTPTSLGVVVKVSDAVDKTSIDLTEYENW